MKQITVLSLGAGVQSTTLSLMIARGELPPVDCAIFADTGWEPESIYSHLNWLETQLPFPVHRVSIGNLRDDILAQSMGSMRRLASAPWFLKMPDGSNSMARRQCTQEYKLTPIRRKVRELLGGKTPKGGCEMLIGISTDEASRMKPSQLGYIVNKWPLIEAGMSRRDCLKWMRDRQYPEPGKSSCLGCPFHNDAAWRDLRDGQPEEWADTVALDKAIRNGQPLGKLKGMPFMHRSCVPLDEVDLSTAEDRGQLNLFNNECEGMCGV